MGTAQVVFAGDRAGDRTIAHDRKWRDRKWRQSRALSRSMFRPSEVFWPEVTKSRDRKRPCAEVCSAHAGFTPRFFFLLE